jgi:pyridoxamine 5'-phosphate oxidase
MTSEIAHLRQEYSSQFLLEAEVAAQPLDQFRLWWYQAIESKIAEPNAMTLATASLDGMPSARIVLLKGFDDNGFVFFTNYNSYKAMQLAENPKACLVFFWKELERQVRITGLVTRISEDNSSAYFDTRPETSRIGAWASPQSQVISDRDWLDKQFQSLLNEMKGNKIERPPHWGGYIVQPVIIEFWQGRPNRLHDRIQYSLQQGGEWKIERLAP